MGTIRTTISIEKLQNESVCSSAVNIEGLWWSVECCFENGNLYASLECMRHYEDYPNMVKWEATTAVSYHILKGDQMIFDTGLIRDMPKYYRNGNDLHLVNKKRVASQSNLIDQLSGEQNFTIEAILQNLSVRKPILLSELDDPGPNPFRLGSGTQADVYKRKFRGNDVAVKQFKQEGNYEQELSVLRIIEDDCHANLLRMKGHSAVDFSIVFEYCPFTLCQRIHDPSFKLECKVFTTWVDNLVDAIHYLHQKRIIHRDIKSENVLISRDNTLRLSDFGISREGRITQMTLVTNEIGTEHYMAPEITSPNTPYTRKADVYSFGVLLWEMTTRRIPEKVSTRKEKSNIAETPKTFPPRLLMMVSKCTTFDAEIRPSSEQLKNGRIWDLTWSQILEHKKDWPEDYKDALCASNGWHFTDKINDDENTAAGTNLIQLKMLQISPGTAKNGCASTVSKSGTMIKGDVYTTCIANSSNDDFIAAVGNREEVGHPEWNNSDKFSKIAPGTFHQFEYPKAQRNVYYSIFGMDKTPIRLMNWVPPNRSVLCDGKDVFLTEVGDVWKKEAQLQMLWETL